MRGCLGFESGEQRLFLPRPACGERSKPKASGEGDFPLAQCLWRVPLTPTLSQQAGRGSVERLRNRDRKHMTIAGNIDTPKAKIDWIKPVLWLFAPVMIGMMQQPTSLLWIYNVTDKAKPLTLQNCVSLFTDPDFLGPLLPTAIIATSSAIICCL